MDGAKTSDGAEPEQHRSVTLVEEAIWSYGPPVLGRLGLNPERHLRLELHDLFTRFVGERAEGQLPDFVQRNLDRLEEEFLDELRKEIAGTAKQLTEPVPPDSKRATLTPTEQRRPGLPRRVQRPRLWR